MRKVFLTGSTSYLGTKFIELYGNHYKILGVSRNDPNFPVDLNNKEALGAIYSDFKPDVVIHLAADLGRDATTSNKIIKTNPLIVQTLINLAKPANTPLIFTSTEAVYGGREQAGGYVETDNYRPRSPYGISKVESEKLITASGIPFLITRGHRYVGISKSFNKPKQFPDTLHMLERGEPVHLDSQKIFTPMLINNGCDIFAHYIENDSKDGIVINIGIDKATTYYDFLRDVAKTLGLNQKLIKPDGEESAWPPNGTLSTEKMKRLGYPVLTYNHLLQTLKKDWQAQ